MGWTDPATVTVGTVAPAALWNTHVRDNLNSIGPKFQIRKAADETVNNSSTLQNDDHFSFAIAVSEAWVVQLHAVVSQASATPGLKWTWTVPAGATGHMWGAAHVPASTLQTIARTTITTTQNQGMGTGDTGLSIWAVVVNSSTAGTVQFQWAQQTATAANTILYTNSFLLAHRL